MANLDPFYNRKPVPDAFIEGVGDTGMNKQEEFLSRERKLSSEKGDLRRFFTPKNKSGQLDPHYSRKPVPDDMIKGVGETGLTHEQEYLSREKKMFQDGVDLRRFSTSANSGFEPQGDPYYGRKPVNQTEIEHVGDLGISAAEAFEVRENKAAMFDLSGDPFQRITGSGHRGSIAGIASAGAADARRRSSAVAPDAAHAAANVHGGHSGYTGNNSLPPINSGKDNFDETTVNASAADNQYNYGTSTTTTTNTSSTAATGHGQQGMYHDITTHDPDSVAPDERR